jgi:hypothetical protein
MKTVIILFLSLFNGYSYSQIFKSNEQYSGTTDEIQDSALRKEVLAVQDCLNKSTSKNKEVKKIFSSTKDSVFSFGNGVLTFKNENNILTINSFVVWYKPSFNFPTYSFDDLLIVANENSRDFPCKVFKPKKRTAYLFHCIEATINDEHNTVIFISNVHTGFLGRVLIKSN